MRTIVAIDPGTFESAYLIWSGKAIGLRGTILNADLLHMIRSGGFEGQLCIEMVACYGMPVGKETFETVIWIGRFMEAWARQHDVSKTEATLVYRNDIKLHHCGQARAKDPNVRQALIDKYGAPGVKKSPGLTYGIAGHLWSAFAIATYVSETQKI